MEWQQFEYFRMLSKMQHVTKAAEALNISQSALSRSIARFEDEIGAPLFERQGRSIRLNVYGKMFLKHVDLIVREFEIGKQEIQELLRPGQGIVSFGFLHTLSTNLIPDLLSAFRMEFPKINFQLKQSPSHSLLEELQKGDLDLCLISPTEVKPPIEWQQLFSEELFIYVPRTHLLANQKSLYLHDLAEESFILLKKGYALRTLTEQMFKEAGIEPAITFEGDEADTVAGLVAAGLGVSILPALKGMDLNKIIKIPINSSKYNRVIGLAWINGRYLSPAALQFKNFIINHLSNMEDKQRDLI
ncbi:LysR family transcriptional regulator [Niallia nealsonii]|uniref:LysR family transcriptional regulator n=1 Tax=Niallia nealsonii TaxID=115979 RepID=A0A2N0Z1U3_9BACI|nr:LysR family transcriptional regulator [Niallia nealsonii]PKG23472.1 LysR family transcriptional regulator [Niallia nealsonii]